jgi:hypothetical protein
MIREDIAAMDRVRRGEVKVLARMPTDAMSDQDTSFDGHAWEAMWDAAPAIAESPER